jgi:hypothetical protein
MFRNAVPACVLLRKSFRNGVPARSVTKIPVIMRMQICKCCGLRQNKDLTHDRPTHSSQRVKIVFFQTCDLKSDHESQKGLNTKID